MTKKQIQDLDERLYRMERMLNEIMFEMPHNFFVDDVIDHIPIEILEDKN